eukprot:187517_1
MGSILPCMGDNSTDEEKTGLIIDKDEKQEDPLWDLFVWKKNNPSVLKLNEESNNRLLYYNEYGSKSGFPIIHFHGATSSRLEGVFFENAALAANIRLICTDRPGTGLSTMDTEMTYESIANDTKQLIKHLNLKENEYGLSGISQGGPHVFHHLYYLQNEIKPKLAVLISGLPPFTLLDENNRDDILSGDVKTLRNLRINHPKLYDASVGFAGWMVEHCMCECLMNNMVDKQFECESDKKLISLNKKYFISGLKYTMCGEHGMDGNNMQGKISFANWKFDVMDIDKSIPIICFHGDEDNIVPLEWVKLLNNKLSQIQLHVCNGYGHLIFLDADMQNQIMAGINSVIE